MNICIVYFSGTYGTEKFVTELDTALKGRRHNTVIIPLDLSVIGSLDEKNEVIGTADRMIVAYPVYAYDAPKPVYDWIKGMPKVNQIKTYVVSVSGGGEHSSNRACRKRLIKKIEKKNFNVIYEKMITMPCNYAETAPDEINAMLVAAGALSASGMADDIDRDIEVINKKVQAFGPAIVSFAFRTAGRAKFGKSLTLNQNCNGCEWCTDNCPTQNIKISEGRLLSANKCTWCMRCVYGCPNHAIESKMFAFSILKGGFSIQKFEKLAKGIDMNITYNIDEKAKGWTQAAEYLKSVLNS